MASRCDGQSDRALPGRGIDPEDLRPGRRQPRRLAPADRPQTDYQDRAAAEVELDRISGHA